MAIRIESYSLHGVRGIKDIRKLAYYPGLERSGNYQRTRDDFKNPIGAVQHIAVTPEDRVGVDSSAEAVTAYGLNPVNTRASWNDCVDRDSYCPLLPPWVRPWQHGISGMGVDMNEAGIGQEMGIFDTNWNAKPDWFVEAQLRMSAAVWAAWFSAYDWPVMVTLNRTRLFELARSGRSWGLTSHAVIDPTQRSDPGVHRGVDTFPWNRLLGMIKEEQAIRTSGGSTPSKPEWETPEHIRAVQVLLNELMDAGLTEDGIRGPATEAAVKQYQTTLAVDFGHNLDADSSPGPLTRSALEADMATMKELFAEVEKVPGRVMNWKNRAYSGERDFHGLVRDAAGAGADVAALSGQIAGLTEAIRQLAAKGNQPIDLTAVTEASRVGVEEAFDAAARAMLNAQED